MRFGRTTAGAIALALGLTGAAAWPAAAADPTTEQKDITFIVTHDFHGRIDENTVSWAGTVEQLRAQAGEDRSIFLSAGDNFGNSLYASSVQGERPTVDVLNALDLSASAVGNGDLFIGYSAFNALADDRAQFPYLAANMVDANGALVRDPFVVREIDGVRVGIIGVVTPDTQVQFPNHDIEFQPTVEALNRTVAEIDDAGLADVIVALVHEGGGLNAPPATLADEMAQGGVLADLITGASPRISALFTAHTHNQYVYDAPVPGDPTRTRPVIQAGSFGQKLGKVTLSYDPATRAVTAHTAELVTRTTTPASELAATYPRVAAVQGIVDQALAYAHEQGSRPAGAVTAPITTAFSGGSYVDGRYAGGSSGNRTLESSLGTLVANMFRDVQRDEPEPPQFGITIPNFIRSDLMPDGNGDVPIAKIIETFGIRDSVVAADITGVQLKRLFEQQWQRTLAGEAKGYIQLAMSDNLTYTYDDARPEGDRITSITLDGTPIDLADATRTYRVGLTGALLIGIVNFHAGTELTNVHTSDMLDVDGFLRYLTEQNQQHGPVAPDFMKHGATVTGFDPQAVVEPGQTVELDVANLDLTSLGAPQVVSLEIRLAGRLLGTVPVSAGAAHVRFTVPADLEASTTGARAAAGTQTQSVPLELVSPDGSGAHVQLRLPVALPAGNGGDPDPGTGEPGEGPSSGHGHGGGHGDGHHGGDSGADTAAAAPGSQLAVTGAALSVGAIVLGGLASIAGALLLVRGRRRRGAATTR